MYPAFIKSLLLSIFVTLSAAAAQGDDLVSRGEYLTRAADCEACHTAPGRPPFSGGRAFTLPFGVIYSPNITADNDTGLGSWTDDEFVRALHEGIGKEGEHLYPAFPYASYTAMTREDAVAIKAYLRTLPAVHAPKVPNGLSFPFNQRWGMVFWNAMNLTDKRFEPQAERSGEWNRGNYLANALGHCGECHTPRTISFGLDAARPFAGASIDGWRAYNLTSNKESGVGDWTQQDLEKFLSTGHAENHGSAAGPMEEVIRLSTTHLTPEDIRALAVYLKALPPQASAKDPDIAEDPTALRQARYVPEASDPELGQKIFAGACASCHGWDGLGRSTPFASLKGSSTANDVNGSNLIQVILHGASAHTDAGDVKMPAFASTFSDIEIASVANYVVKRFGDKASDIKGDQVAEARIGEQPIDFAKFTKWIVLAAIILVVLIAIAAASWRWRRRSRTSNAHS